MCEYESFKDKVLEDTYLIISKMDLDKYVYKIIESDYVIVYGESVFYNKELLIQLNTDSYKENGWHWYFDFKLNEYRFEKIT